LRLLDCIWPEDMPRFMLQLAGPKQRSGPICLGLMLAQTNVAVGGTTEMGRAN